MQDATMRECVMAAAKCSKCQDVAVTLAASRGEAAQAAVEEAATYEVSEEAEDEASDLDAEDDDPAEHGTNEEDATADAAQRQFARALVHAIRGSRKDLLNNIARHAAIVDQLEEELGVRKRIEELKPPERDLCATPRHPHV